MTRGRFTNKSLAGNNEVTRRRVQNLKIQPAGRPPIEDLFGVPFGVPES
jgi:hypothetical protein